MTDRDKTVFVSHKCPDDHVEVARLKLEFTHLGIQCFADDFCAGDRTSVTIQRAIKQSTHFVLLLTAGSMMSRWVKIEYTCAEHCAVRDGLVLICLKAGNAPLPAILEQFIHIPYTSADVNEIFPQIIDAIRSTGPSRRLLTNSGESERVVSQARVAERRHAMKAAANPSARFHDESDLHEAVALYEQAIELDFCNHHAWLNKGWCLWKLYSDTVAWKYVETARLLRPDSQRVGEVIGRMRDRERTLK